MEGKRGKRKKRRSRGFGLFSDQTGELLHLGLEFGGDHLVKDRVLFDLSRELGFETLSLELLFLPLRLQFRPDFHPTVPETDQLVIKNDLWFGLCSLSGSLFSLGPLELFDEVKARRRRCEDGDGQGQNVSLLVREDLVEERVKERDVLFFKRMDDDGMLDGGVETEVELGVFTLGNRSGAGGRGEEGRRRQFGRGNGSV